MASTKKSAAATAGLVTLRDFLTSSKEQRQGLSLERIITNATFKIKSEAIGLRHEIAKAELVVQEVQAKLEEVTASAANVVADYLTSVVENGVEFSPRALAERERAVQTQVEYAQESVAEAQSKVQFLMAELAKVESYEALIGA